MAPSYVDGERRVRWLDSIPPHWGIVPSKWLFDHRKQRALLNDEQLTASQDDGVILQAEFMRRAGRQVMQVLLNPEILKHVEKDDFVISMRSFQGGLERAWARGCISSAYVVLRPKDGVHVPFFAHLFKSIAYIQALQATSNLVRDGQALRYDNFLMVHLPRVPLAEQKAIAAFLDRKTAAIDALIEKKRKLLELLAEKRAALINQAVTKGLDPNVPMKDSGIPWIGEIPAHWKEHRLKTLFRLKHGYAFDGAKFSDSGDLVLMTPGNFHQHGGFRHKYPEKFYRDRDFPSDFVLEAGQLLVAMTEQAPGLLGCALVVPNEGRYLHNQRLGLVKELRTEAVSADYLFHLLNSSRYRAEVSVTSTGSKVKHTSPEKMLAIKVWLPPLPEQRTMIALLDRRTSRLDNMAGVIRSQIGLLAEYRQALITAAVTGRLDITEEATA